MCRQIASPTVSLRNLRAPPPMLALVDLLQAVKWTGRQKDRDRDRKKNKNNKKTNRDRLAGSQTPRFAGQEREREGGSLEGWWQGREAGREGEMERLRSRMSESSMQAGMAECL